jgi:membrane-anchored protein YejM (alkaline phosphatase superfamily)
MAWSTLGARKGSGLSPLWPTPLQSAPAFSIMSTGHIMTSARFVWSTVRAARPLTSVCRHIIWMFRQGIFRLARAHECILYISTSYESCISYLDRQVGILVDEIERRGLMENTLVIVTSDHGELFGEHGLYSHGNSLYRREVHVPLLVIPPSRQSTVKIVKEPVSFREIPATVAEWVDLGPRNPFLAVPLLGSWVTVRSSSRRYPLCSANSST